MNFLPTLTKIRLCLLPLAVFLAVTIFAPSATFAYDRHNQVKLTYDSSRESAFLGYDVGSMLARGDMENGIAGDRVRFFKFGELLAARGGIPRNAAVFEIETQGGMLTRDGRTLQSGAVKSRTDFLNQTPVRRVDFDHTHGNLGAPHVNPLHVNPNNPSLINAGRPRLPEPGEYLSPVLSDPRIQGGVFRP